MEVLLLVITVIIVVTALAICVKCQSDEEENGSSVRMDPEKSSNDPLSDTDANQSEKPKDGEMCVSDGQSATKATVENEKDPKSDTKIETETVEQKSKDSLEERNVDAHNVNDKSEVDTQKCTDTKENSSKTEIVTLAEALVSESPKKSLEDSDLTVVSESESGVINASPDSKQKISETEEQNTNVVKDEQKNQDLVQAPTDPQVKSENDKPKEDSQKHSGTHTEIEKSDSDTGTQKTESQTNDPSLSTETTKPEIDQTFEGLKIEISKPDGEKI